MSRSSGRTSSCLALLVSLAASPSFAQEYSAKEGKDQDASSIVVTGRRLVSTATKTEVPLIETPQSISVVTRQSLELRNVQRVKEALRFTAGVQVDKYGGDTRFDQIELRGFSATIFGEYRDGLRQVSNGSLFFRNEAYGLESVEVLKGPSSVLFGQNAPGGLVNYVSKRPTAARVAEMQVDLGNWDRYQVKADLGGSLNPSETVLARVTVLGRDGSTQLPGKSRDDRIYIAPAITFQPTSRTSLTLYTQFLKNESNGQPFNYTDAGGNFTKVRTYDPNYDQLSQQQLLAGWTFEQRIGDVLKFRQNARYGEIELHSKLVGAEPAPVGQTIITRLAFGTDARLTSKAIDNQLSAELKAGDLGINLLAGYDYTKTRSRTTQEFAYGPGQGVPDLDILHPVYGTVPIPTPPSLGTTRRSDKQGGFYGQAQLKYSGWILTGGVRRDKVSSTDNESNESATTFRVGLTKLFEFGLAPYVSYATSFQIVPGFDRLGNAFVPSHGKQIEGGVKYQPRGFPGFITASAYKLTQDNVLTLDPEAAGLGFSVQTGEIEAKGVEFEAQLNPIRGLAAGAAFAYQHVEVTKSNTIDLHKTPPGTPKLITSAYANYEVPDGALAGLGFGGAVRYTGRTWADQQELVRNHDGATYFDGFLSYSWTRFRLGLNVDNMFDKRPVTCNFGYCYQIAGRSILGSIRYRL
ncbi:TonB-dependent siderophore receptor [Flavisphingomonas formosensis]|uniref:TonB-dependent siderophore receptor n=1 Tax=Flavisphingomonas formosensis TaxID=861534 RepID=UPI0012F96ACF|nr:TonB-dependent siderophore receptor [Sphingomonas formosensis]